MVSDAEREHEVGLRPIVPGDRGWLLRAGWSPELAGRQYHWIEVPLQVVIGPLRAWRAPAAPAAVIEVDGRRAGYIGPNPLSGNYEYFLAPWARGGVGRRAITAFLAGHRRGDHAREFFVSGSNDRSLRALLGAFTALGWQDGVDYRVTPGRWDRRVWVRADRG